MELFNYLKEMLQNRHPAYYRELAQRDPYQFGKGDVKPIAFYLPQFHEFAENNEWWGKGFTEWTNVSKAMPQFEGHYQPHLPGELGYYNVMSDGVLERQAELARMYGVYGFCFHFYMFDERKRLLEKPLNKFLANTAIELPFCLCYANENWTRKWDGTEYNILAKQSYGVEFAADLAAELKPYVQDSRYIRIDNKPLIIIYRINILPDPEHFAESFRKICLETGIGEIYLCSVLFPGIGDACPMGFDDNIEFPLHQAMHKHIAEDVSFFSDDFGGIVLSYPAMVESEITKPVPFKRLRGVMPSWDNEARQPGRGYIVHGSTPQLYKTWLQSICNKVRAERPESQRFVFINAWNEWAEGAHLEPDRRYGYAYLEATYDAVTNQHTAPDITRHDFTNHNNQHLAPLPGGSFPQGAGMQLYYQKNGDIITHDSRRCYFETDLQEEFVFDLDGIDGIELVRIDPADCPVKATIFSVDIIDNNGTRRTHESVSGNANYRKGNEFIFFHEDPILNFETLPEERAGIARVVVKARLVRVKIKDIDEMVNTIIKTEAQERLDLTNSISWRITKPLREIAIKLRGMKK